MVLAPRSRAFAWGTMPFALVLITTLGRWSGANAPTVGFFYLIVVMALAALGGWPLGATASVASMLSFNYFFLSPLGTLAIAEPDNWVALISFLAASTFASRMVATARRQAEEAQRRRREVQILYELCFALFTASQRPGILEEAASRTLQAIGADSGGLFLDGEESPATVIGPGPLEIDRALAERARETREVVQRGEAGSVHTAYVPLHVGDLLHGLLVARGVLATRAVLEPAGRLLALAIERERLLEEAARLAAVQASDALKTSLLRAVSHDLLTPLTSMRLEIESLDRHLADRPEGLASLRGLSLEQERLALRIDNLLALARLEAGLAHPHPEPVPPASLFRAARESLSLILAGRPVEVRIDPHCPDVWTDPSLTLEILVNLLENAARASPTDQPLDLAASAGSASGARVLIDVRDRGPGVPSGIRHLVKSAPESPRRIDPGSGDSASGGLGLRIALSFAEANGGTLSLLDRPGGGTIARLELPAASEPEELKA